MTEFINPEGGFSLAYHNSEDYLIQDSAKASHIQGGRFGWQLKHTLAILNPRTLKHYDIEIYLIKKHKSPIVLGVAFVNGEYLSDYRYYKTPYAAKWPVGHGYFTSIEEMALHLRVGLARRIMREDSILNAQGAPQAVRHLRAEEALRASRYTLSVVPNLFATPDTATIKVEAYAQFIPKIEELLAPYKASLKSSPKGNFPAIHNIYITIQE